MSAVATLDQARPRNIADNVALCARTYGLPAQLVAAIVEVESAGTPGAIRFDPDYGRPQVQYSPR